MQVQTGRSRAISVTIKRVQTGDREYDAITVVMGDLHLRCDAVCDRDIKLAKRLADDHQAWFQYDEHCAPRVQAALGIKE